MIPIHAEKEKGTSVHDGESGGSFHADLFRIH